MYDNDIMKCYVYKAKALQPGQTQYQAYPGANVVIVFPDTFHLYYEEFPPTFSLAQNFNPRAFLFTSDYIRVKILEKARPLAVLVSNDSSIC